MKVVQLYGLRRSGTHAVINWLRYNFSTQEETKRVGFLNNLIELREKFQPSYEWSLENCDVLLTTYEDTNLKIDLVGVDSHKIVLIRDIYNLAASRLKRGSDDMKIDENFVDLWLQYSSSPNLFKYEDFLLNKDKRDELCERLGVENLDYTDGVMLNGGGSSFVGVKLDTKENYLSRYKMVEFPEKVSKLLSDVRIQEVREKLGYSVL
jgi:hypothetical protein